MQRLRFLSVILLILLASLFVVRFSFYSVARTYLAAVHDIHLDMEETAICGLDCLAVPRLTVDRPGAFRFEAEGITVRFGLRREEPFRVAPLLPYLGVRKARVTVSDLAALTGDDPAPADGALPYFPIGQIAVEDLSTTVALPGGTLTLTGISLKGDGRYTLDIPIATYAADGLRTPIVARAAAEFGACGHDYSVVSVEASGAGVELSLAAAPGGFTGRASLMLDQFVSRFDDRPATGAIVADLTGTLTGDTPRIEADVRATGLGWNGEFRLWDLAARLIADPRGLTVDQLALFNRDEPFLSLGGRMEWRDAVMRGKVTLWDLDFMNTLKRFQAPCWVNMWISGTIDYDLSFKTLTAQYRPRLTVRGFNLHDDGTLTILNLKDIYQVIGRGEIRAERITLDEAEVTLRDDTTHIFLHDTWFDLDGDGKIHIMIRPRSWIDLSRVGTIAELPVEGRGNIDMALTSFYESPRIVGHFKGSNCAVQGFEAGDCDLTVELKDFVLSFLGNSIAYRSVRTEGSRVAIDFNKTPTDVSFLFNNMTGMLGDIGPTLRRKLPPLGGRFLFHVEGRYAGHLAALAGHARADKVRWGETALIDQVAIAFVNDGDDLRLTKGAVKRGDSALSLSGTMNRRTWALDARATLDAFFAKDLDILKDVSFAAPRLTVTAGGTLFAPSFAADLFLGQTAYQQVAMGNFSATVAYDLESGGLTASGNLGDAISFRGALRDLDMDTLTATAKVKDFIHKRGDLFFKTSLDASWDNGELEARVQKIMVEKGKIFARNTRPFTLRGRWANLAIDPFVLDGETLSGTVRGEIRGGVPYLDMTGTLFPAALAAFTDSSGLRDITGNASFRLSVRDRAVSGELSLQRLGFTLMPYDAPVAELEGTILFEDDRWRTERLRGLFGNGKMELRGSGPLFPSFGGQATLSVTNASLRHRLIGPFSFSTYLDIAMPEGDETPTVNGDVEIKNILYRDDLSFDNELVKFLSRPSEKSDGEEARLNLRLFGRNNLRVQNNLIKSDIAFDTRLGGTLARPTLNGVMQFGNGEIIFKQNRFPLDRGLITFEPGDRISPFLDIQGTTRIYARSKETEYKAVLTITGPPDNLAIRLSTVPQLEETQAYSLLLWGDFFDPTQPGIENLALVAVTDIMGISEEVKKNFRLSRFELLPRYSEIDYQTVLKIVAVKEIYPFLVMTIESNPADPADQMIGLSYRGSNFDLSLDWKYKNKLETNYGGLGLNLALRYLFE